MNMDLQHLHTTLENTFAANFVAYYRAHVAHVNIKGRNFYQDHKLLETIYEYFQDNIDTMGEKIRTVQFRAGGIVAPSSLAFSDKGRLLVTPGCFEFAP